MNNLYAQTHFEFMKDEAKKMYKSMRPEVKRTTSVMEIYRVMKKAWKAGDSVKREHRQSKTD